jgi:hypothetical protein
MKVLNRYGDPSGTLAIDRGEIGRQANQAPWMGLMRAGLGMASEAGKHPWEGWMGNMATGAGEGLTDYAKQADAAQAQNLALSQEQRQANKGILGLAVQEHGQDVRAKAMADREDARARMAAGAQNKSFMVNENNIRQRATDLGNADGWKQPPSAYHLQAAQEYNQYAMSAGAREDVNSHTAEQKAYQNATDLAQKSGETDPIKLAAIGARAVEQHRSLFGAGGGAPAAGGNIIGAHPATQSTQPTK